MGGKNAKEAAPAAAVPPSPRESNGSESSEDDHTVGPSSRRSTVAKGQLSNESTDDFLLRILSDNRAAIKKAEREALGVYDEDDPRGQEAARIALEEEARERMQNGEGSDASAAAAPATSSSGSVFSFFKRKPSSPAGNGSGTGSKTQNAVGEANQAQLAMNDNLIKMRERGEKVNRLGKATEGMLAASADFAALGKKMKQ